MASTLTTRICNPGLLTPAQRTAIETELGVPAGSNLKISIWWLTAITQEIRAGRLPTSVLTSRLTVAERGDAQTIRQRIQNTPATLEQVANLWHLGEEGTYTPGDIEGILVL